jgi:hypothetical protein
MRRRPGNYSDSDDGSGSDEDDVASTRSAMKARAQPVRKGKGRKGNAPQKQAPKQPQKQLSMAERIRYVAACSNSLFDQYT